MDLGVPLWKVKPGSRRGLGETAYFAKALESSTKAFIPSSLKG